MQVKYFKYSVVGFLFAMLFTGCFESTELSKEVGITGFAIPNQNGYLEFASRTFEIDEVPGADGYYEIINTKPFPFGALEDSLYFAFTTERSNAITTTIQVLDTNKMYVDTVIQVVSNRTKLPFDKPVILKVFAQDANYTREYRVTITADEENPDQVDWQGPDVLAEVPFDPNGYYTAYAVGSTVFVLYGMPDESAGTITNKLYSSSDGKVWTEHGLTAGSYPAGIYHAINTLKGKVYCFSSLQMNASGEYVPGNTVWSSTDGITWQQENTGLTLGQHAFHSLNKLNGKLFAFGGTKVVAGKRELTQALYDTVYTDQGVTYKFPPEASQFIYQFDGTSWTTATTTLPLNMPARFMASSYAKGRIYCVNGESTADGLISTSTWATENGTYWLRTGNQTSEEIEGATLVNYTPYLWRIGGKTSDGSYRGIMETVDDGDTWFDVDETLRSVAMPPESFAPRHKHTSVVDADNRLWIIGGQTAEGGTKEVWIATKNVEL